MSASVNRRYEAPRRAAAAAQTRTRILRVARTLFTSEGWNGTSVTEIARQAQVSVDTVYASVGRKPVILREIIDDVLGEGRGAVPAEQRQYVAEVRAATTAADKIAVYAAALGRLMPQVAPLLLTLRDAGLSEADCARAWTEVVERRAHNMRLFAADLRVTGELRDDLTTQVVADLVWTTNSPEYFTLLTSRGWSSAQYAEHLTELWQRLLLAP